MSTIDNDETLPIPDELTTLKQRADTLGIPYHPSIGLEKLREKVAAAIEGKPEVDDSANTDANVSPEVTEPVEETMEQRRARKRREATELIRVNVTCMNPAKKEWEGELFTAGNSLVGSHTKFVPFNTEDGWHIPRILYNQISQRQCQIFVTSKDSRGNSVRTGKLIKEFGIEILPMLTQKELDELARRQAMSNNTAD